MYHLSPSDQKPVLRKVRIPPFEHCYWHKHEQAISAALPCAWPQGEGAKSAFWSRDMSCQAFEICRFACNHLRVLRKGLTMAIFCALVGVGSAWCGRCACPPWQRSWRCAPSQCTQRRDPPCRVLWAAPCAQAAKSKSKTKNAVKGRKGGVRGPSLPARPPCKITRERDLSSSRAPR